MPVLQKMQRVSVLCTLLALSTTCCAVRVPINAGSASTTLEPNFKGGPTPPPPPFDHPGGVTILYNAIALYTPARIQPAPTVVMADRQILSLVPQSQTTALINSLKNAGVLVKTVDCTNLVITPGLIDVHVHVTGGGENT